MQVTLKQIDRLVRETTKIRDSLKTRLESAKAAKAEKKTVKAAKPEKEALPAKFKAVITALTADPIIFEQVRALIRIHRKNNGPAVNKVPA